MISLNRTKLSIHLDKVIPSLFLFYSVGIIGMYVHASLFQSLTPLTLVLTLVLLLLYHPTYHLKFVVALFLVFLGGYGVEVLGVQTGLIFGIYHYGETLGFALWDVPLMMGVNWVLMVYSTASLAEQCFQNTWLRALLGASLMVLTDYFIEPVAVRYDFWQWQNQIIPLQNYGAWFVFAFMFHLLFNALVPKVNNSIGKWVWLAMLFFFGSLHFLLHIEA